MASHNVGARRLESDDPEVPAELPKREAQDRAKTGHGDDNPRSPVDAMHVDEPKHQDNARGHKVPRRHRR